MAGIGSGAPEAGNARRSRRRSGGIAAVVLALLLVVCSGIALAAGSEPEADEAGLATSAQSNPVELKGERTATSKTFQLPDGSRETRVFEGPINYRDDDGVWKRIDSGLEETDRGSLENGANHFDLTLPDRMGAGAVRLATEEGWLSYQLLGGASETAELEDGSTSASYNMPAEETRFDLTSTPEGVKESIVLDSPSAPNGFQFALRVSSGLRPELTQEGAVVLRDEEDRAFAYIPAPIAWDASGAVAPKGAAYYELQSVAPGEWRLGVEVDSAWLTATDRSFPVTIDPSTFVAKPAGDSFQDLECLIDSATPTTRTCAQAWYTPLRACRSPTSHPT